MPGETTQGIALCAPYAAAGAHDPHQAHGGAAWCPGNPPRHPDGTPVTGDEVRALQEVPLAGELRDVRELIGRAEAGEGTELRGQLADALNARAAAPLVAEQYAVQVGGIDCRIVREYARNRPAAAQGEVPAAWWAVTVDRSWGQEVMTRDEQSGMAHAEQVRTGSSFPFDPADVVAEQAALERAGEYARDAARAVARLWVAQQTVHDDFVAALQAARERTGGTAPE